VAAEHDVVLGRDSFPAEDELRLPRPPGVFRRFWARHPRWADALLAILCLLLTLGGVVASAFDPRTPGLLAVGAALSLVTCIALLWRRRWPVAVFAITLAPALLLAPALSGSVTGPAPVIALYSVAVYRSSRAAMWSLGAAAASIAAVTLGWTALGSASADAVGTVIGTVLFLAIGALIGVNVGNRKRYVAALIDRSRQLAVERDQQARLAAADERTRIAREMHDIVSHSLTVVVALADGASATGDAERAREASRAIATTAREALTDMRAMLGVLRTGPDESAALDAPPREPLLAVSLDELVAGARGAGFPVTLTVASAPRGTAAQHLGVLRIVQEGLTNAMRYSRDPRYIRVRTEYTPEAILVRVENDGALPHAPSAGAGLGLQGLRERVAALGGTLTAGFIAPDVWRLSAELPSEDSDD
jgi:signal transduction histidine kinase